MGDVEAPAGIGGECFGHGDNVVFADPGERVIDRAGCDCLQKACRFRAPSPQLGASGFSITAAGPEAFSADGRRRSRRSMPIWASPALVDVDSSANPIPRPPTAMAGAAVGAADNLGRFANA